MKYKKMHIYRLKRSSLIDKDGRPAIYLSYFGNQSLVWCGTTISNDKAIDEPLAINLEGKNTYFYNRNITKISSNDLIGQWRDSKNKIYTLTQVEEEKLITKFAEFTNQKDPYQRITFLEIENQFLKKENQLLKQREQELQQQLESGYEIE